MSWTTRSNRESHKHHHSRGRLTTSIYQTPNSPQASNNQQNPHPTCKPFSLPSSNRSPPSNKTPQISQNQPNNINPSLQATKSNKRKSTKELKALLINRISWMRRSFRRGSFCSGWMGWRISARRGVWCWRRRLGSWWKSHLGAIVGIWVVVGGEMNAAMNKLKISNNLAIIIASSFDAFFLFWYVWLFCSPWMTINLLLNLVNLKKNCYKYTKFKKYPIK